MNQINEATLPMGGKPIADFSDYYPVLVWDDYHGFIVGRRNPRLGHWVTDQPYAFEFGSSEFEIEPVLWWPLPEVPAHVLAPIKEMRMEETA